MTHQSAADSAESSRTITLKRRDIQAAARLLRLISGSDGADMADRPKVETRLSDINADREKLIARAREALRNRRKRREIFGETMFGEPAWAMLLALYVAEATEGRMSVGKLSSLSGGPPSTAQRWIDYLIKRNLAVREPHPTDRRTVFVKLSDAGRAALDLYFFGTLSSIL